MFKIARKRLKYGEKLKLCKLEKNEQQQEYKDVEARAALARA